MYVTRPLSLYRNEPSALSLPPSEGPNSGVLVIQDEDPTVCFGLLKSDLVSTLPFPQNKNFTVEYKKRRLQTVGESRDHVYRNHVLFIPVINQPLSSNLYYVINIEGDGKGNAYINSKEEDMKPCCFGYYISDLKPQPLDPHNIDHQFMIHQGNYGCFVAKSAAPDGFPPYFLRRNGWQLRISTPKEFPLREAAGIDKTLRARLPDFNFSSSHLKCSPPVVVGKWYCPFMFVKEGDLNDQMKASTYYEMTLEQRWELIFSSENYEYRKGNAVDVDVSVRSEVVRVGQKQAVVWEDCCQWCDVVRER